MVQPRNSLRPSLTTAVSTVGVLGSRGLSDAPWVLKTLWSLTQGTQKAGGGGHRLALVSS